MSSNLDDFCLNDCVKILKKKLATSNFTVNSYKFCPLDEVKGFLGDYCYLVIKYRCENIDERARFFVKIKSTSGRSQDFLNENSAFSKECRFYQQLVLDISKSDVQIINDCVPQCYFVSDDRYLIFEELGMQGYTDVSTRAPPGLDYIKSGLDALVKLHCSGLIYEERMKKIIGVHFKLPQNYAEVFAESFFPRTKISKLIVEAAKEGAEALIDLNFRNTQMDVEQLKKLAFETYDSFFEIVKPSTIYRNTLCHGDLWNTNIMSKFENGEAVHSYIIDFQMVRYGPPAQDFTAYLFLTTNRKFRQEHMQNLILYYYKRMTEIFTEYDLNLTEVLSYKEFVESCNYYKTFACALAMNHHQLITLSPEATNDLLKQGILQDLIYGGRPKVIRDNCNTDDFYKEKLKEDITEFRDILIENKLL